MNYVFNDKNVSVKEFFMLVESLEGCTEDRFPASSVFHTSLRNESKEKLSLDNSISVSARDGNRLVGFLKIVTDYSYIYNIVDVMVSPEYRGRGIARKLINMTLDEAKKNGFIKVSLTAIPGKEDFYKSFGFKEGMSTVLSLRGEDYVS